MSRQFSLVAQITRQAYERLASSLELLRTAGAVALELADVIREIETRRRQNKTPVIASLREQETLRSGLSLEEATDVLWALTSHDLNRSWLWNNATAGTLRNVVGVAMYPTLVHSLFRKEPLLCVL